MSFDRGEIQRFRERSLSESRAIGTSDPLRFRAYVELAFALDHLDAMLARDSISQTVLPRPSFADVEVEEEDSDEEMMILPG